jgi:hypothetical protein
MTAKRSLLGRTRRAEREHVNTRPRRLTSLLAAIEIIFVLFILS